MASTKPRLQSDGGSCGMWFYYSAQCSSYFAQCPNITSRFRRVLLSLLVLRIGANFLLSSNILRLDVSMQKASRNDFHTQTWILIEKCLFVDLLFLLKGSSFCCDASSVGEFRVGFNVNFKLFLYFNSDLLPSTRSFFSILFSLVPLIRAAEMQDSNRYWSFVSLHNVRRLIVIVNFMFRNNHCIVNSRPFAFLSLIRWNLVSCAYVFPSIVFVVSGKLRNQA